MPPFDQKSRKAGRHPGIVRRTHITSAAYIKNEHLGDVIPFWEKKNPAMATHAKEIIQSYLCALGWDDGHERYNEVRDLAIRTISRSELLNKIFEKDFTRNVRNPVTGNVIKQRQADQIKRIEAIDDEILARIKRLGLL